MYTHFYKMPNVKAVFDSSASILQSIRYFGLFCCFICERMHTKPITAICLSTNYYQPFTCAHVGIILCMYSICLYTAYNIKPKTYGQQKYIIQSSNMRFKLSMCCLLTYKKKYIIYMCHF